MNQPARDHFLAEHARLAGTLPGDDWVKTRRAAALEAFAGTGLPTIREEAWKYTNLRSLEKQRFTTDQPAHISPAWVQAQLPSGLDAHRLVFINGLHAPELSAPGSLPAKVTLEPLSTRLPRPDENLRAQLDHTVNGSRTALTDLNTAFMSDGLFLQLADGAALERPVHLLYISTDGNMAHLRNLVRLGRGSEAVVIEQYVGMDDAQSLTTAITEVQADRDARLTRARLQQETPGSFHIGGFYLDQSSGSHARLHSVDLGGRLVRNDTHCRLRGPGTEVQLHGVYAPAGHQHIDNHTRIDHLKPQGTSREAYRGVLDGHGRGVFNGKIVVHPGAQKTDSEQSSAALLLSKTAEVDAKPELEIYADDVKCAHGATVGQLDEAAVFYLQSRGVDTDTARSILTYSFADEVIRRVGISALYKHIESHFLRRLPNGEALRELL